MLHEPEPVLGTQTAAVVGGATPVAIPSAYSAEGGFQVRASPRVAEQGRSTQTATVS
jgi:hypothetical protein